MNAIGERVGGGWQAGEKKSAVLDLSKHVDQRVRVKFTGGREGKNCSFFHVVHVAAKALEGEAWCVPRFCARILIN